MRIMSLFELCGTLKDDVHRSRAEKVSIKAELEILAKTVTLVQDLVEHVLGRMTEDEDKADERPVKQSRKCGRIG